jgi:hypothetical protein
VVRFVANGWLAGRMDSMVWLGGRTCRHSPGEVVVDPEADCLGVVQVLLNVALRVDEDSRWLLQKFRYLRSLALI